MDSHLSSSINTKIKNDDFYKSIIIINYNMNTTSICIDESVEFDWISKHLPSNDYWSDIEFGLTHLIEKLSIRVKDGDSFLVGKLSIYPYKIYDSVNIDLIIERKQDSWLRIVSSYWEYDQPVYLYKYDIQDQVL